MEVKITVARLIVEGKNVKLTKTIVGQISFVITKNYGRMLGYMINVRKECKRVILCEKDGKLILIPALLYILDNDKSPEKIYYNPGQSLVFESKEYRDKWYNEYKENINNLEQIYV